MSGNTYTLRHTTTTTTPHTWLMLVDARHRRRGKHGVVAWRCDLPPTIASLVLLEWVHPSPRPQGKHTDRCHCSASLYVYGCYTLLHVYQMEGATFLLCSPSANLHAVCRQTVRQKDAVESSPLTAHLHRLCKMACYSLYVDTRGVGGHGWECRGWGVEGGGQGGCMDSGGHGGCAAGVGQCWCV